MVSQNGKNGSYQELAERSTQSTSLLPAVCSAPAEFYPDGLPKWPRAEKPLTVALLGWARLSSQVREGSGYNLNCSDLARGLVMSGHRVVYLASGMSYRLWPRGPHLAFREKWGGVECYEVRNAPTVAPSAVNFAHPEREVSAPETTRLALEWLDDVGAQVVHIHSAEGFGLDLIGAIRSTGRPVVVTAHNYHSVCPQVDLLYREREVCTDYEGGNRCVGCLAGWDVAKTRRARAVGQSLEYALGLYPADVVRKAAYGAKGFLRAVLRGRLLRRFTPPQLNAERIVEPEVACGFELPESRSADRARAPGLIRHDLTREPMEQDPGDYARSAIDTNERVLANRERHLVVLNNYGQRRAAGVAALAAASLVTPPSDYLRRVLVSMGVPEERTRWVKLGQPHFDQIHRATKRSPFYDARPWDPATATRPLRFAFLGTTRPNKGLEVLARAVPLLEPDVRRRCHFLIRAGGGGDRWFRKRLSLYPEVSVYGEYDNFLLISARGEYDVGILSHIWLENSPLVLLENLHAGKFTICARLGGPVDFISQPGEDGANPLGNGLFFAGGDEAGLASAITRVVTGEVELPSAREVHAASMHALQSYPAHVREVESIYRQLLGEKPEQLPQVRVAPRQVGAGAHAR